MSALREWAASIGPEAHGAVAVSSLGKWKTASQMVSLALLLLAKAVPASGAMNNGWSLVDRGTGMLGVPLLIIATGLTLLSLMQYFAGLWRFFTL